MSLDNGCPANVTPWRNDGGFAQYRCNESFFGDPDDPNHPLKMWTGYFVIIGLGVSFGVFTVLLVALEQYLFSTVRAQGGRFSWRLWQCVSWGGMGGRSGNRTGWSAA